MRVGGGLRTTKGSPVFPQVVRVIEKLGRDISLARRMRRIPAEEFARRMGVSRATLHRLEKGDPGISLNTLAMAMAALGRLDAVADLADATKDDVGLMLARQQAPRRVQRARPLRPRTLEAGAREESGPAEPDAASNGFMGW